MFTPLTNTCSLFALQNVLIKLLISPNIGLIFNLIPPVAGGLLVLAILKSLAYHDGDDNEHTAVESDIKGHWHHDSMAKMLYVFEFCSSLSICMDAQTNAPNYFATKEFSGNVPYPLGLFESLEIRLHSTL
jgi:hypothetical protein